MTQATQRPRTCLELGLCQHRQPPCVDCEPRPLRFAPGVIDGPYRRSSAITTAAGKGFAAMAMVVAWLMGPHP